MFRIKTVSAFCLPLLGMLVLGCEDDGGSDGSKSSASEQGSNGSTNGSAASNGSSSNGSSNSGSSNSGSGTSNSGTGTSSNGSTGSGTSNTGSSTSGQTACTDTPRSSESCKDAVSWGFCGQGWFAGNCDASCGVCKLGSNTGSSSTGSGSSTSGSSSGNGSSGSSTGSTGTGSTGNGSSTSGSGSANAGSRVDNPYAGAKGYVNPEWKARADAEPGGKRVSDNPTGVWMDRIAAIDGTGSSASMGMRDHLEEALAQKAGYIQFVIYDLPGRDCAALSSNGELKADEIERYKTEYIDPIAEIQSDPKYASLRIINIIEIDSLPNLVTNTGGSKTATAACDTMKANGNYEKGVAYALGKLYKAGNTYNYIDAGHHGWIGWETNFNDSAALLAKVAKSADGGADTVTGFITNTANYSALEEPFIKVTEESRQSKWIDFNQYVDELSFAKAFRTKLVSLGMNSNIGMLIDTSRNGWGGPKRPTKASTSTDVNTMIEESRIDRRFHLGNWCNQSGAGLGERPKVVDKDGIDAYVWIKPPGESDGASKFVENDQGKGVDGMCDPTYGGNARNNNNKSGALGDAPLSGAWFSSQFQELMTNAYPAL
ncbi:MAG TPA: glycoside hydrolase family 6 protein [Polyangiaceae bacterium]|nr:glycoside hydrolase family 6 protein [Polyangiaceae bacterium]